MRMRGGPAFAKANDYTADILNFSPKNGAIVDSFITRLWHFGADALNLNIVRS